MQSRPPRPAGITIIAIMVILGGVIGLLVSLAILGFSALLATVGATSIGSIGAIIGGVFLFFSLLWLAVGIGFLSGKGCAWTLGMIVTVLSLLGSVSAIGVGQSGGVLGLVFWGLLIYYLTLPTGEGVLWQGRNAHHSNLSADAAVRAACDDDQLSGLRPTANDNKHSELCSTASKPSNPHIQSSSCGNFHACFSDRTKLFSVHGPGNSQLSQLWKQACHRAEQMLRVWRQYLARLHG